MDQTMLEWVDAYGYLALAAVGFAEMAGLPLAGAPLLVAAGSLYALVGLHPVLVLASTAAGALVADLGWFFLVRWRGDDLVEMACGLTSHPGACVLDVKERVSRLGMRYVVPAKFVPGVGNLVAAASALAGLPPGRFALVDGLAVLLWAGAWTTLGRLFTSEVQAALGWVARYQQAAAVAAAALVVAAGLWRVVRIRRHREAHGGPDASREATG